MAGNVFDDAIVGFGSQEGAMTGLSGAVAGAMIGGTTGSAPGAIIGAGLGFFGGLTIGGSQARKRRKAEVAAQAALDQEQRQSLANRNKLVEENFARRSRGGNLGLSSSKSELAPGQKSASTQGTSLLASNAQTPSLFDGSN